MLEALVNWLLLHREHNWSYPITIKKRTYRVCLDCGLERDYDWEKMRFKEGKHGRVTTAAVGRADRSVYRYTDVHS